MAFALEDVQAILGRANWHLCPAMAIALLAPKLRVANILALKFSDVADERT